jgi:hypothetical protein
MGSAGGAARSATVGNPSAVRESRYGAAPIAIIAISAVLLVTMEGALFAAPLTIPLLVGAMWARPRPLLLALGGFVLAATAAEAAWAVVYLVARESKPWIWLVPAIGAGGGVVYAAAVPRLRHAVAVRSRSVASC